MTEVNVSEIITPRKLASDQMLTDATKNGPVPADLDVQKPVGAESTSVNSAEKKEKCEVKSERLDVNCDSTDEPDNEEVSPLEDLIIVLHLDIEEPLQRLRKAVEEKVNLDLSGCGIWLLNSQQLDDQKNLVEQGVEGEGQVQIHVELKSENETKRINIVDVLKPAEEYVNIDDGSDEADEGNISELEVDGKEQEVVRWVVDPQFKKKRAELDIPEDPLQWNLLHVGFWLEWAKKTFNLTGIDTRDWNISGQELCNMNLAEFRAKVPNDPGDLFWTHLELLRKCRLIATTHSNLKSSSLNVERASRIKPQRTVTNTRPRVLSRSRVVLHKAEAAFSLPSPNHSGNNGQIQLWQFLLELLTDWKHVDIIRWRGTKGEFRFVNPEEVARLWGKKKRKPTMNYEKLSRALRYYYEGDMISKVQSKRFVYKFVCNLKDIIGYDAKELRTLVSECAASNGKEINYTPEDLVDF